jgi:L-seryl-tRNA(Ser) seleniumtransferase
MRPDKVTLLGVAATLGLYRAGLAVTEIPVWRMIALPSEAIRARADALSKRIGPPVAVVATTSTIGGGALPGATLPSAGLAIGGRSATRLLDTLRLGDPSVIGRIEDGRVVLDLRTVDPGDDEALGQAVAAALAGPAVAAAPAGPA